MGGYGRCPVGLAHTGDAWRMQRLTVQSDSAKEGLRVVPAPTSPRDKGETHPVVSQVHSQEDVAMKSFTVQQFVTALRRRSIADLNTLQKNKRFLSKSYRLAVEIVQDERRHRMGGN